MRNNLSALLRPLLKTGFGFGIWMGLSQGLEAQAYCTSAATSTFDSNIGLVVFGTINNSTLGVCATYSNFTAMSTNVTIGQIVPITVTAGTCGGNYTKYGKVYIDWNRDFDFVDPGEEVFTFGPASATNTFNGNVTVPGTAIPGSTRMRVVVQEAGSLATITPCGSYTWGETEDYTVNIAPASPNDVGVTTIISPNSGCNLTSTEQVTITINNFGTNTQTTFNVGYRINGGAPVIETVGPISLPSLGSYNYTFVTPANLGAPGTYTIKAWTSLASDGYVGNDSSSKTVTAIPGVSTFPYCENFESGQGGWLSGGTSNTWAYGTPAKPTINSAASGTKAWVTGGLGSGTYNNNEQSYVIGPCFDFSTLQNPWISLSVFWHAEFSWDGAVVQTSTNFGATWQTVGAFGDPFNWYTDNSVVGTPGGSNDAWTGTTGNSGSGGWVTAAHQLTGLAGQPSVRLRIAFGTDGSVVYDGVAFDDVCIGDGPVPDLGPDTLICIGDTLFLNPGTFATYDYSTGTNTQIDSITALTTGTISVMVTDAQGFYGTDTVVVLSSIPSVNLGPDSTICPGDTLLLNASWPNATYSWVDASTDSLFYAITPGTVWVDLTDSVGCHVSDTMVLTFAIPPTLDLGPDTNVCSGQMVTLDGGPGPVGTTYVWNSGATTQILMINAAGTYSASVTTPGGCAAVDTVVIGYLPAPGVNLGPDITACGSFTLDAGTNGTSYLWSTGDPTQTITGFTGGTYAVTVTNAFGCSESDDIVVTMGNIPLVNLGPDQLLCNGATATLDAGNPGSSYLWSTGATTQNITVSQPGLYIVFVTDPTSCVSVDSVLINSSPLVVNLGPDVSVCNNGSVTLDAGNPGMSYVWSNGATTQSVVVNTAGTYTVTVTDAILCSATDQIVVSQAPSVTADFTMPASGTLFQPTQFTDASTPTPISWSWNFGDGGTSTLQNPTHTYVAFGTVNVTLIVNNGSCRDTIVKSLNVINFIGVDDAHFANALQIYPNPSQDVFHVSVEFSSVADLNVEVFDLAGKRVFGSDFRDESRYNVDLNLGDLPKGIYVLKLESEGKTLFKKLVLQ